MRGTSEPTGIVIFRCVWYRGFTSDSTPREAVGDGVCLCVEADVLAHALPAVGQENHVAAHVQQRAAIHVLAGNRLLGEIGQSRWIAIAQMRIRCSGSSPSASSASPLTDSTTRIEPAAGIGALSFASSKYISLTIRR